LRNKEVEKRRRRNGKQKSLWIKQTLFYLLRKLVQTWIYFELCLIKKSNIKKIEKKINKRFFIL